MEENEKVAEEATQETNQNSIDESKFESAGDDSVAKLDLSKPIEDDKKQEEQQVEGSTADDTGVVGSDESSSTTEELEEVQQEEEAPQQTLEEVISEEPNEALKEVIDEVEKAEATGKPLPENVQKLVDFMEETGGSLKDYVELNTDVSELDNMTALEKYYQKTKPHLSPEELSFMLEDNFSYDNDIDDEKDIMRKKLALKEEVASAKQYLEDQKTKYYEEIKNGSALTPEANKALEFFNRYNKEQEANQTIVERQRSTFDKKTDNLFNDEFKGFEYKVGDKTFRYNIKNAQEIKNTQSDINNFVKRFLAEDNTMSDAKGYHKSLYTAMNADSIAQHFYEQGKADALKDSIAKSKNVSMQPRQGLGEVKAGGTKFKVLGGETSADFKVKLNRGKK
tara:strand:- start:2785 stop:3969 length:1185 start_codon:yes stop_codon:yes gene_type:complete